MGRDKERAAFVSFHEGLPLEWEGYKEPLMPGSTRRLGSRAQLEKATYWSI
jgi:hypothetical protein